MSVTPQRQQRVDFPESYMTIGQTILLAGAHSGSVGSFRDLDDPGYKVASKPGTTGEVAVRTLIPNASYSPFDTETEGAMAVLNGEVDAFVYDLPFNAVFMAMHDGTDLIFLDEPFTSEHLAWAIRKDDPDFQAWLNRFLAELRADGRYQRYYEKWFKRRDWFAYVR